MNARGCWCKQIAQLNGTEDPTSALVRDRLPTAGPAVLQAWATNNGLSVLQIAHRVGSAETPRAYVRAGIVLARISCCPGGNERMRLLVQADRSAQWNRGPNLGGGPASLSYSGAR